MYIQRKIHQALKKHLARKEYTIITGPRQCGKTSLIKAIYKELQDENKQVAYITFEDQDILSAINIHPEEVFSYAMRPEKTLNGTAQKNKKVYLFIDEIQYAANPSNFLKYLYDVYGENLKIIATGSSAFYIDDKFKDSLAGRKRIFELQTLSFDEWLQFTRFEHLLPELEKIRFQKEYISPANRELTDQFNDYLVFGGYPEVALENDINERILLLKELKNAFLKKDIDEAGISYHDKFYMLLSLLAGQTGNLVNRNELANTIGVDNKTVDNYLYVLQNSFHIELIKPFYSNLRKELTKMPKVYFKDSGMRNSALNRFYDFKDREDQGQLLENYVYTRLTNLYDKDHIKFWRTADKKEIDFVVTTSFNEGLAYEIKMNCRNLNSTSKKKFTENYPGYRFQAVSYAINNECQWVLKL
ncbi:MAG: ATP-binding protein [Mariniphaga sp.]|nr:ATP-binding protein [Mariniphaga sp.]